MSETAAIDTSSPVFLAAVEARAAELSALSARAPVAAPQQVIETTRVEHTSIGLYNPSAVEVTVRFRRFCLEGRTSYMAGQEAGFASQVAARLVASGHAVVVHMHTAAPVAKDPMSRRRGA